LLEEYRNILAQGVSYLLKSLEKQVAEVIVRLTIETQMGPETCCVASRSLQSVLVY